jgi:hypothetical protein
VGAGFKSKKIRVNLNLPIKAESSDVLKAVDEDRKYVIQATIVCEEPGAHPGGHLADLAARSRKSRRR